MKKGIIVLIPFPFTNGSGFKTRPALILTSDLFDVTVVFITSKKIKKEKFDVEISLSLENGLKVESILKINKLATIERSLILGELGKVSDLDIIEINKSLRIVFDL
jgi:mRNA interferase MazF